jgi:hypothetical protein
MTDCGMNEAEVVTKIHYNERYTTDVFVLILMKSD